MANMTPKLVRRGGRRRIKKGAQDGKTWALFDAGLRLLARYDYEHVSMAKIAKAAGCSVGALYNRFPEKDVYLYHLIGGAFRTLTEDAKLVIDGVRWPRASAPHLVKQIVSHVVTRMATVRSAGVVRATLKLAATKPATIELFKDYRVAVTERAVALLAPRLGGGNASRAVRVAMQIVFATVTDAILQKDAGPLRAGSKRMIDTLSNFVIAYLGLASDQLWVGSDAEEGDDQADYSKEESEDAPELPPGDIPVYDPDLRVYRGSAADLQRTPGSHYQRGKKTLSIRKMVQSDSSAKGLGKRSEPAKVVTVTPPRAPPPTAASGKDSDKDAGRRKRNIRLI